jgi:hypothetical protein
MRDLSNNHQTNKGILYFIFAILSKKKPRQRKEKTLTGRARQQAAPCMIVPCYGASTVGNALAASGS